MSALRLTQRAPTAQRLDMSKFTPTQLSGMPLAEIARLPIHVGNRPEPAGELFEITGSPGERMDLVPCACNLDNVGAAMAEGEVHVQGDVGYWAGRGMSGGVLTVEGNAGDEAGSAISGGRLQILGNAGERIGGPPPGATRGMSGGLIHVCGNAGDRAGERMRRGTILIEGDCGAYCGLNIITGTIAVLGGIGEMAASGMRRGTLLLGQAPEALPSTFVDNGIQRLSFLSLLIAELNRFAALDRWSEIACPPVHRLLGDLAESGMGEILWPAD
jgi:formylmethanofuran dehydrogenase subunit C